MFRRVFTKEKVYIGDGVYVRHDDFGIVLTTENGVRVTNTIYLEPEVWKNLEDYVETIGNKEQ